jgi:hypothetical protein
MLSANLKGPLDIVGGIVASKDEVVRIDADGLIFAEPLPLCLLSAQLNRLSSQGQSAVIERVRPEVADRLRKMNVLGGMPRSVCGFLRQRRKEARQWFGPSAPN